MKKGETIFKELKIHLPFTFLASLAGVILVSVVYLIGKTPNEELFEILHPAHVLVSALATSAIYWKYKKSIWGSVLVGVGGAILIGSLSDIIFPFFTGNLFHLHTHFHLPIIEEPLIILGVAFLGSLLGRYHDFFDIGHSIHVFLSVFASLFYLLAFSIEMNVAAILLSSILIFFCVFIPCCISDIVFPLLFLKKPCRSCGHWHE